MHARFTLRLQRLARLVALLPPKDPFAGLAPEELERARAIVAARTPHRAIDLEVWAQRGQEPPAKPDVAPADAAWFLCVISPLLPAWDAFRERHARWERQFRQRPRTAAEKLACIFPAFAGARHRGPLFDVSLPDDFLPGLARLAGEGYEPAIPV
jgi:hypothetical protein